MAKITQYPAKTVPSNNDEFVFHEPASGSTKKMTRGDLIGGAPLPAGSVDEQAIADGSVTAAKTTFGGDYSLSEVNTGFTWIDGKPIYKRTLTGTITAAALSRNITSISVSGIGDLIRASGYMALSNSNANAISIGSSWTNATGAETYNYAAVSRGGSGLSFTNMSDSARTNRPYAITIEYTKV